MSQKATATVASIVTLACVVVFAPLLFIFLFAVVDTDSAQASTCIPATNPTSNPSSTEPPEADESNSTQDSNSEGDGFGAVNVPAEYIEPIKAAAKVAGLPESIVAKQIQAESNFNRMAGSSAGAKGPAQFTDSTWALYGNGGDVYDVEDALDAYGRYMRALADQVAPYANGDANLHVKLTLAAYNAGPGAVAQFKGIPPYSETQNYVNKILSGAQVQFSPGCRQVPGGKAWDGDLGDGEWTNPCPGCVFTSPYGLRDAFAPGDWRNNHVGIDLASPGAGRSPGTTIIAPTDMKVVGFLPDDGCVTAQQNGAPGFQFNFCHLDSWDVQQNQELKRGDIIGIEGGRGGGAQSAYATHLHFEIYDPESPVPAYPYNGHNLDPEPILKEKGAWISR